MFIFFFLSIIYKAFLFIDLLEHFVIKLRRQFTLHCKLQWSLYHGPDFLRPSCHMLSLTFHIFIRFTRGLVWLHWQASLSVLSVHFSLFSIRKRIQFIENFHYHFMCLVALQILHSLLVSVLPALRNRPDLVCKSVSSFKL